MPELWLDSDLFPLERVGILEVHFSRRIVARSPDFLGAWAIPVTKYVGHGGYFPSVAVSATALP